MKRLSLSLLLAIALALGLATVAFAQTGGQTYTATLNPLSGSGASGTATVTVNGNQATVDIQSAGLAAGAPHAQHIHIGGQNVCPPASADADGSGSISVSEGAPFYGPIAVPLTTTGDVSPASALAVDRMPVANADGTLSYSRTFTLPGNVTPADIANGVIVQHGIDFNGNGTYDMSAGPSDVDPSLPFEATVPADCGKLVAVTTVPETGGISPVTIVLLGGSVLVAAGLGVGYLVRRRTA